MLLRSAPRLVGVAAHFAATSCSFSSSATARTAAMSAAGAKIARLRELMRERSLAAYIVPSEDAHSSEYIAPCDKRRHFLTGMTGSAGFAIVTAGEAGQQHATLWTDGRYWLQATAQMSADWTLMKLGLPSTPSREEWLCSVLPRDARVGVDPRLIPLTASRQLQKALGKAGISLVGVDENLVDLVWGSERPARPCEPLRLLADDVTGASVAAKLAQLRDKLASQGKADGAPYAGFLATALDDVAWLFNLRGSDIAFNPVFFAYAYVDATHAILYTDNATAPVDALAAHVGDAVAVRPYDAVWADMSALARRLAESNEAARKDGRPAAKVLLSRSCNWAFARLFADDDHVDAPSPITAAKAIKNSVELECMRRAHIADAVALCHYFAWIEQQLNAGAALDEISCSDKLDALRAEREGFVGPSFETISASGPNGAIVHYRATPATCRPVTREALYLCDSGGQYIGGTTDVTRTLHFGTPSARERRCFTRVLQGHIALDATRFPEGVSGFQLDVLARRPLWTDGLNYTHGTGHGVGAFLNVHEGPHGIGTRVALNEVPLQAGMTVTNEPGYYEDGAFGIRIENVLIVKEMPRGETCQPDSAGGDKSGYLCFQPLTLVPIQTSLIDRPLLSADEIAWINAYHARCREVIAPHLPAGSPAHSWLISNTEPI